MTLFWKTAAGIMIAVILILAIEKQERDLSMILCLTACVMTGITAFTIWEPVLDFVYRISEISYFRSDILKILIKISGIGIITELARHICIDGGYSALAHGMQLLGTSTILVQSLPVMENMFELLQKIMGGI